MVGTSDGFNQMGPLALDLRQGGAWQFLESADDVKSIGFEGEYLVIESDERLVFT